jgi:hypothetical protein
MEARRGQRREGRGEFLDRIDRMNRMGKGVGGTRGNHGLHGWHGWNGIKKGLADGRGMIDQIAI